MKLKDQLSVTNVITTVKKLQRFTIFQSSKVLSSLQFSLLRFINFRGAVFYYYYYCFCTLHWSGCCDAKQTHLRPDNDWKRKQQQRRKDNQGDAAVVPQSFAQPL